MALGVTLGLGFNGGSLLLPARYSNLSEWLDPSFGVVGAPVTGLTARKGTSVYSAAGGARPTTGPGYLQFDGTANTLSRTADSASHPGGASRSTLAGWLWTDDNSLLQVPWATDGNSVGVYYQSVNTGSDNGVVGPGLCSSASVMRAKAWTFVAIVFDASLAGGQKIKLYRFEDPTVTPSVVGGASSLEPGTVPGAAGSSLIGSLPTFGRYWKGRQGHRLGYWGDALSAAEIAQSARATKPGHLNLVCAGNSLTAGDGSTGGANGWPTQIAALLPVGTQIKNAGHSGWQTSQLVSVFSSEVTPEYRPASRNVLVAWEVGNSMYYGASPRSAVDQFWAYCDTARASGYQEVYAPTLTYRQNLVAADVATANGYLRAEWASHVTKLVDVGADPRLSAYSSTYFYSDQIHLNDAGYGVVASLVKSALGY